MEKGTFPLAWHKEISSATLKPGNFFYGEQAGSVKLLIQPINEGRAKDKDVQLKTFFLFETDWAEILDEASNLDIFSSARKKIFMIYFPEYEEEEPQSGDRAFRQLVSANQSLIERYFFSPPPNVFLVIIYSGKLKKGQKLLEFFLELKKKSSGKVEVRELKTPRLTEILSWIDAEAASRGKTISQAAARKLLEVTGPDFIALSNELEKLSLYVGEQAEIKEEDILNVCFWQKTYDRFAIEEALESGSVEEALNISASFFAEKPDSAEIINFFNLISRYLISLNQAKLQVEKFKVPVKEVFKKDHPQIVEGWTLFDRKLNSFERCLKAFTQRELDDLVHELARVDMKLKSSDLEPQVLIETLLVYFFELRDKKRKS
jgi:DNA polymerase-3 subunit delta